MDPEEKNRIRQQKWQQKAVIKGDKRINVYLNPAAMNCLEIITKKRSWTKREAIEFALMELAKHVIDD
jgi:hypothetical protein